jgi:hypothetical protein
MHRRIASSIAPALMKSSRQRLPARLCSWTTRWSWENTK